LFHTFFIDITLSTARTQRNIVYDAPNKCELLHRSGDFFAGAAGFSSG
jgi:hypothetical protein